jgi:glycosyltransferase involved in cell wall biosynthesis
MVKVFYITHQMTKALHGGSEVQLFETMKAINTIQGKYNISLFNHWEDDIQQVDLVHFFNPRGFLSECLGLIRFVKQKNIPVVVSPIFYSDLNRKHEGNIKFIAEKFQMAFREATNIGITQYFVLNKGLKDIINEADLILPNTEMERDLLSRFYGPIYNKSRTIPNGVNSIFEEGDPSYFYKSFGLENFILFIGRIEPRKNILRLIEAFKQSHLDTNLVIIGSEPNPDYARRCKQAANDKVMFIGPLEYASALMRSAYKSAKVLVLPSHFETPGIAALEGGLSGANVLITKNGGTHEYFGDLAWYLEPDSTVSISKGLSESFNAPKSEMLSNHIRKNFLWKNVGDMTVKAYDSILS